MTTATKRQTQKATAKLILAVAYIRMSTDQQEDSPERQRAEISAMAEKSGYQILHWYEDHGLTGTKSKNRPQFQKLLKDAQKGEFTAILMHEQSRFGRETALQFASHLNTLNECGVSLVTRKGKVDPNDIGGFITTMVEQFGNRAESENIAHRSSSGKRQKLLKAGTWFGESPFGYDRLILDENQKVIHRVKYGERYHRSPNQGCRLALSEDSKVVTSVRKLFLETLNGSSAREIVAKLNAVGHKTRRGNPFKIANVYHMLRNPVYHGAHVVGVHRIGQFSNVFDEQTVIDDASHDAIIDRNTFEKVQELLAARSPGRFHGKSQRYLLSGLVVCGHCGRKIYGKVGSEEKTTYQCSIGSDDIGVGRRSCVAIGGERLENAVIDVIKRDVLSEENLLRCERNSDSSSTDDNLTQSLDLRANELKQKISTAQENLSLATDAADFTAISQQLRVWRKELSDLVETKAKPESRSPFEGLGLEDLKSCRDDLDTADRGRLADALHQAIESIILTSTATGKRDKTARVLFHPETYTEGEILIPWEKLRPTNGGWMRTADIVASFDRAVNRTEVAAAIGLGKTTTSSYLWKCHDAGLIRKTREGWVAK